MAQHERTCQAGSHATTEGYMNASHTIIWYDQLPTPIGKLLLVADRQGLREICFEAGKRRRAPEPAWIHEPARLAFARKQLNEYFAGTRTVFDLPLHPIGTLFQERVWRALAKIPYGATISYGQLARRIGQPSAARAVGAANGRNPLPIVVPCHRVVGADGTLTGFGGGLSTKQFLLAVEEKVARGDALGMAAGAMVAR